MENTDVVGATKQNCCAPSARLLRRVQKPFCNLEMMGLCVKAARDCVVAHRIEFMFVFNRWLI